jgi:hypothetical protein
MHENRQEMPLNLLQHGGSVEVREEDWNMGAIRFIHNDRQ